MEHFLPYLNWIDTRVNHMKDLVIAWGNINSHAMNISGLEKQLKALKESFSELGGEMQEIALPPYTVIDEHGGKSEITLGKALSIKKRLNAPLRILFSGHMDTVHAKNSKFQKVTETAPGTLLGPGVCDMKGGLVVLLTALQALEKSPYAKNVGWEVIINPDEEIGSPGSGKLLEEAAKRHHIGLVFEPAHSDGAVVTVRPGSLNLVIVIHGKSAHAGRDYDMGRSALLAGASLVADLETIKNVLVNVGEFRSGNSFNIVPDLAIISVNVRAHREEEQQAAKDTINSFIAKQKNREGISFEMHEQIYRPPKRLSVDSENLLRFYQECSESQNIPFNKKPSGGVSDANILTSQGLATLDTLGVIGGDIHTHNEYLLVESLPARAKLAALLLMRLGNSEFTFDSKTRTIEL